MIIHPFLLSLTVALPILIKREWRWRLNELPNRPGSRPQSLVIAGVSSKRQGDLEGPTAFWRAPVSFAIHNSLELLSL